VGNDADLREIVILSLEVSLTASLCALVIGGPLGTALAVYRFRGRGALIVLANALLGLPPVVVGLAVYLLLSRSGPLGAFGVLFTPTAMVSRNARSARQSWLRWFTETPWDTGRLTAMPCWSMAHRALGP
jgi:ABC-type tungstate transport system substrate-binding protein